MRGSRGSHQACSRWVAEPLGAVGGDLVDRGGAAVSSGSQQRFSRDLFPFRTPLKRLVPTSVSHSLLTTRPSNAEERSREQSRERSSERFRESRTSRADASSPPRLHWRRQIRPRSGRCVLLSTLDVASHGTYIVVAAAAARPPAVAGAGPVCPVWWLEFLEGPS